ncbi:hypothetical protein K9L16_00120 [Candidatus Pacearchaeota archaeon]|nr:hypothetical protein [Candidatus Pacearchaeota archaeon]
MEKNKEKNEIDDLKKKYSEFKEKYSLPSFEELNKDFAIEKISQNQTEFLLREIRRFMADKFVNYLRFIEVILQPANAPIYIYSIVKILTENQKNSFSEVYKKLSKIQLELFKLDIEFSEQSEVDFIKNSFEEWQEIKKDLLEVINFIEDNWEGKSAINSKNYFS